MIKKFDFRVVLTENFSSMVVKAFDFMGGKRLNECSMKSEKKNKHFFTMNNRSNYE